jgi:hypothetical protein
VELTSPLLVSAPFLAAACLVTVALGALFVRSALSAAWVLVGVWVVSDAIVPPLGLQVTLSGLTIYGLDVVIGLMFVIGAWRLVTRPNPPALFVPLAALSLFLVLHALWGLRTFGLQQAVNGSRDWLYFIGPLVFATQASPSWTRKSFMPWIVGATALSLYANISIARYGLHPAGEYIVVRGELVDARPVLAMAALLMIQCLILAPVLRYARPTILWLAFASMASALLLLQFRMEWMIAMVVILVAYLRWARTAIHTNERLALVVAAAVLAVAPVGLALTASSSAFAQSAQSASGPNSSAEWRWKSWTELLAAHSSTQDRLIGLPAGTPLVRKIGNGTVTQSPHNEYVDALLGLGVFGVLALAYLWILVVKSRRRVGSVLGLPVAVVVLLVVSQALFGIANSLDPTQALLLGMLLQASCGTRTNTSGVRLA